MSTQSRVLLVNLTVAKLVRWYPAFYRAQKYPPPPLDSILSQMNPVHSHLFTIHFNIILSSLQ